MRLAVPFHLGDFVQRLPHRASFRVIPVDGCPVQGLEREHHPVGEIAIVRDGENLTASLLLIHGHPSPQVFRITRIVGPEREDPLCLIGAVPHHQHAVQIVARR